MKRRDFLKLIGITPSLIAIPETKAAVEEAVITYPMTGNYYTSITVGTFERFRTSPYTDVSISCDP